MGRETPPFATGHMPTEYTYERTRVMNATRRIAYGRCDRLAVVGGPSG
jgi:hypothetical protein